MKKDHYLAKFRQPWNSVVIQGTLVASPVALPASNPIGLRFTISRTHLYIQDGKAQSMNQVFDIDTLDLLTEFDGIKKDQLKQGVVVLIIGTLQPLNLPNLTNGEHAARPLAIRIQHGQLHPERKTPKGQQ